MNLLMIICNTSIICIINRSRRDHEGHTPLRRSVGDINAFQNNFAFIISTETCFWLKRVSDGTFFSAFQKGVSNPLIKTALRLSSAKITLKVVWKP